MKALPLDSKSIHKESTTRLFSWLTAIHKAYDKGLFAAENTTPALWNLLIRQELSLRQHDLDQQAVQIGKAHGLQSSDLERLGLHVKESDLTPEEFVERDVTLLPVEKKAKKETQQQIVLGVVLEPDENDAHKDTVSAEEIEREAHIWLATKQHRGLMHTELVNSKVEIYESYVAPIDMTLGGQKVKKGTWLLMLHVLDPDLWGKIQKGELTGLSIGGFAHKRKLK